MVNAIIVGTIEKLTERFGMIRTDDVDFSQASILQKAKDILMTILGIEMSVFGNKFARSNALIVFILYMYYFLLRMVASISYGLCSLDMPVAKSIGNALVEQKIYTFGAMAILGMFSIFILFAFFKFFIRLFVFVAWVFCFVEGPIRPLFYAVGVQSIYVPLIIGVIVGVVTMAYFEKLARKSLLILLFSVVGSALLFVGLGEIFKFDNQMAKSIIDLTLPTVPLINILKESAVFWLCVALSIVIQLVIS